MCQQPSLKSDRVRRNLLSTRRVVLAALVAGAAVQAAPPVSPLPTPLFSLDATSPTITSGPLLASDVLEAPGPVVAIPAADLGMGADDDADALSRNLTALAGGSFALLFSVDLATIGVAPPAPPLVAAGVPYNVTDQAARGHAAGDRFLSTLLFTTAGVESAARRAVDPIGHNTLANNHFNEGGTGLDLTPEASAADYTLGEAEDEVDGTQQAASTVSSHRDDSTAVYFSVTSGSPFSLSGAHIFYNADPGQAGTTMYASAGQLGLDPTDDDIDALVVFDLNGNGLFDGTDQVLFSLARGSASGAAVNVFTKTVGSPRELFASPPMLGLGSEDNIDALQLLACSDGPVCAALHGVRRLRGDCNNNGQVGPGDYSGVGCVSGFYDCLSGPDAHLDDNGVTTHAVAVGGVDDEFDPANLVIEVGDTVRWVWTGGLHNVVSGRDGVFDGSFISGPPTGSVGHMFEVTFDVGFLIAHPRPANVYPYFCGIHHAAGMTGTIAVKPHPCATFDFENDGDVDLNDFTEFEAAFNSP